MSRRVIAAGLLVLVLAGCRPAGGAWKPLTPGTGRPARELPAHVDRVTP